MDDIKWYSILSILKKHFLSSTRGSDNIGSLLISMSLPNIVKETFYGGSRKNTISFQYTLRYVYLIIDVVVSNFQISINIFNMNKNDRNQVKGILTSILGST